LIRTNSPTQLSGAYLRGGNYHSNAVTDIRLTALIKEWRCRLAPVATITLTA